MDTPTEKTGENTAPPAGNPPIAAEPLANATPAETVTADELAGPLAENMPVPTATTENAQTEIAAVNEAVPPKPIPVIRDKSGKLFDPSKHAVDGLGQPRFNKNGFFVSKFIGNPGKKKDGSNPSESQSGTPSASAPTSEGETFNPVSDGNTGTASAFASPSGVPDQYDQTADMYLQAGYGLASSFLGNGIRPEHKVEKQLCQGALRPDGTREPDHEVEVIRYTSEGRTEHESLRFPLAAMLREKQSTGMTPTQMFLVSLGAFVARKAAKPTVRERFTLLALKVRSWFKKAIPSKQ